MNKSIIAALLVSALGFSSCGGNDAPVKDTSIMPARDSVSAVPSSRTTTATSPADLAPINSGAQPMSAPVSTGAAGMNPEHGMPGHRCDIAVGAPLNSLPGSTAGTPQVQPAPTPAPASSPVPGATGKLNPPHGQPGHDCAIAVGAPLKN